MSKRIWQHPEVPAEDEGITSWRSVGELEKTPEFKTQLEREFPEGAGFLNEEQQEESRRGFMKLMGASAALSGLALVSCRRPESYIVPYKQAPEWIIPGKPLFYATSQPRAEGAVPLVVTTYEGRPTKLEPNREHPQGGGTDALTQASVLDLYDPHRSRDFLHKGKKSSREEFSTALAEIVSKGGKIGFLFGEDDCPTRNRLKGELAAAFPGAEFYSYEALAGADRRAVYAKFAQERTAKGDAPAADHGAALNVDFSKADRVLSLDCDFLGLDPQGNHQAFSVRRHGGEAAADYKEQIDPKAMNRLYSVETAYSLTGGIADHRLRVTPTRVLRVAVEIARALGDAALNRQLESKHGLSNEEKAALLGDAATFDQWVQECANDLKSNRGGAVVLAGTRQQGALHELAMEMNRVLGAFGSVVTSVKTGRAGYATIENLQDDLSQDKLDALFLLGPSNPAYDAPIDQKLALHKTVTVHLGLRTDKTAHECTWHVPAAHYLESWSDARTAEGTYSLVQPMILPLYGGTSELELLAQILTWKASPPETPLLVSGEGAGDAASPAYDAVRATFVEIGGEGDDPWKDALKNGFVGGTSYEGVDLAPNSELSKTVTAAQAGDKAPGVKSLEVNFLADASVWDGRYIGNGWLQEAPDPISKLAWDNAAYVSPATAKELGVYDKLVELSPISSTPFGKVKNAPQPVIGEGKNAKAPYVILTVNGKELKVPMLVAFGHADHCVSISVGYGQGATDNRDGVETVDPEDAAAYVGWVGVNSGFNAYTQRNSKLGGFIGRDANVQALDDSYPVALLQEHNAMEGRALAREVSTNKVADESFENQLERVSKQGPVDSHAPENKSQYKRRGSAWEDDPDKQEDLISDKIHQWGMAIDLNVCTGCNSCLIACQAENNIPIVGKEQVAMGREMHWIRMDRYYATPTYEHDDHGYPVKDKKVPEWVSQNPELVPQPMACVQCENAPCETVCPVNATVHTEEGLNSMAYNRCIGTRYCANNCPYKARRFNYFDYNKRNPLIPKNLYKGPLGKTQIGEAPHLQRNPNVSVRMRGVMEKCTYCVQRLESAKIKQKQIGRDRALRKGAVSTSIKIEPKDLRVKPDTVKTACQQSCPVDAISFGNLLDKKNSKMWRAKYKGEGKDKNGYDIFLPNPRNYDVLNYVGTVPRTSYLARVKNPNAAMPDAKYRGLATVHTHHG